jgi:hypothetical protein
VKRWLAIAAIFAAGIVLGVVIVWALGRDDSSSRSGDTVAADKAAAPKLSAPAQELLDRFDAGAKGTYHVRYSYSGNSGTSAVMEVWRKAERVRRDLVVVSPVEGTARTEEILDGGKLVRCLLLADHPWQCTAADVRQAGSLQDPLNGVNHDVAGKTVGVTTEQIAGHDATCYTITPQSTSSSVAKPVQFCFSAESVPVRIDGGDGKPVTATNYDFTVDDSVFTPPAAVAGGQAT